ncbi:uncharacterized protein LTR77_005406 [Saxophila tyrrhenica]|uniref:Uncharacterized protein n=1 Tax=Saxophila tyrrhenica TaxID=1690608 RepID=A0AAV9PCJ8_9PEZI|nr:hypothetical protein LTR77_005406 [Saxophila tyrrhenica]
MDDSALSRNRNKRSRSPQGRGASEKDGRDVKRYRSRSPHRHKHHHHKKKEKLPFRSPHLHRHDFDAYKALFADYLDLQKDLDFAALDDREIQGRWKSFLNKWNRGELAEGWYDPETKRKADDRAKVSRRPSPPRRPFVSDALPNASGSRNGTVSKEDESDDDLGPAPATSGGERYGPSAPGFQDLQYKRELAEEDRANQRADLRYERKQDRKAQKERLEELAPRAEPGSRERQLEKKRDAAMSNRAFAESKDAGTEEVGESDLMGDGGVDHFKAKKKAEERQKNERELRKEERLRAREAEREERLSEHRKKEEKTMEYLRTLAQQRFGAGS